jgi:laminin G domain protein
MRSRHFFIVMLTTTGLVVGTASQAGAFAGRTVASWQMNESAGARTMTDDSGHHRNGRIGGEVRAGVRTSGATGYRFSRLDPDTPPTHPGHVVTVPDASDLDPGTRDYTVTLRLRTTGYFGNVVQKGQATVAGGSWKIQIPSGVVQCWFRGSSGQVLVSSPRRYNDGNWHTIGCERTSDAVTLTVDGSTVARRYGRTGRIANSWPVSIGGKTACDQIDVGCDYYYGDLDWVQIGAR